jgi:hypothetical protein
MPAYKEVGERRYREIAGLYYEDFEPGDVFFYARIFWFRSGIRTVLATIRIIRKIVFPEK